jgi:hypothetical protein
MNTKNIFNRLSYALIAALVVILGTATASYGATVFYSRQVGTAATNGYVLQTNGTDSTWVATSTLGITGGSGTPGGTSGQLQYNANGTFGGVATTSVTCSGNTTCTTFTVIGGSPITISSTGGGTGLSTTSPISGSDVLVYSSTGAGAAYGSGTSTPSIGTVITYSGTLGKFIGGVSGTFGIANSAVTNAMLQNSTISGIALGSNLGDLTATNGTLTFSGTYNGSTARTIGLNLGNANSWTALQQFNANASTTQFSAGRLYIGLTATTTIDGTGNIVIPSGSGLTNTGRSDGCATWASAVLTSTGVACGSGGSFPFTPATTWGLNTSATTTPIWGQAGVFASSTSATVPAISASNTSGPAAVFGQGSVGIGSTSPHAELSVHAPNTSPTQNSLEVSVANGTGVSTIMSVASSTVTSLLIGTTTPANGSASATTTIYMNKLQFEGGDSAGVKRCVFMNSSGSWTTQVGACL